MLFSAIDIGSNAVRLLFSNVFEHDNKTIAEKSSLIRIPLRLGEDVFSSGKISDRKINDLLKTLKAFKLLLEVYQPISFKACATAAMREAENNTEIVARVKEEIGIDIEIISGLEEAKIVCASNNFDINPKFKLSMYIDVGGGSTEISILQNQKLIDSNSFNLGTIRLLNNKIGESEWERLKMWLLKFENYFGKIFCIGSGGNINKLAKLYGKRDDFLISYDSLMYAKNHLTTFTLQERIEYMGLRPDRADVIVPATQIFLTIMKTAKIEKIYVPRIGLPDGIVHLLYEDYKKQIQEQKMML